MRLLLRLMCILSVALLVLVPCELGRCINHDLATLSPGAEFEQVSIEELSRSTSLGLAASVVHIRRVHDTIVIDCLVKIVNIHELKVVFSHDQVDGRVLYWDKNGSQLRSDDIVLNIDGDELFHNGVIARISTLPPKFASTVAVSIGDIDLVTKPITLPTEP